MTAVLSSPYYHSSVCQLPEMVLSAVMQCSALLKHLSLECASVYIMVLFHDTPWSSQSKVYPWCAFPFRSLI